MAQNGPTLTKATYDKKRSRSTAPSPARVAAKLAQDKDDAARTRAFNKLSASEKLKKLGLTKD